MIKEIGKMTANVDQERYGALLAATLPSVISNDDELERLTEIANQLVSKDIRQGSLSPEEDKLFELLTKLIMDYEREHYAIED